MRAICLTRRSGDQRRQRPYSSAPSPYARRSTACSRPARGVAPQGADLDALHNAYVAALTHARIVPTADGCAWTWRDDADPLDRMLWPVVRSAIDLLTVDEAARVKECPGE